MIKIPNVKKLMLACFALLLFLVALFYAIINITSLSKEPEIEIRPDNSYDQTITVVSNKFYLASDGLFDQPGGKLSVSIPFGYKTFEKMILLNHGEKQSVISDNILNAFEEYRGNEPRVDDFELITFKP